MKTEAQRHFDRPLGSHLKETVFAKCPACGTFEFLLPGSLNFDQTVEYRHCETKGHAVEFAPTFIHSADTGTRFA